LQALNNKSQPTILNQEAANNNNQPAAKKTEPGADRRATSDAGRMKKPATSHGGGQNSRMDGVFGLIATAAMMRAWLAI
jgi:hypothetical protein